MLGRWLLYYESVLRHPFAGVDRVPLLFIHEDRGRLRPQPVEDAFSTAAWHYSFRAAERTSRAHRRPAGWSG